MSDNGFKLTDPSRSVVYIAIAAVGLNLMFFGLHPIAAMSFMTLSAMHWIAGNQRRAWAVVALSGIVAAIAFAAPGLALFHSGIAALGCLAGALVLRGWPFGQRLAAVATPISLWLLVTLVATWSTVRHDVTILLNARIAEFDANADIDAQWTEIFRWFDLNFLYLGAGCTISSVVLAMAGVLCVVDHLYRPSQKKRSRRSTEFQRMRLPDWLVWAVIATALLWFWDQRWPHEIVRVISWNSAIALTSVYLLNGFSILSYALTTFKATRLASLAIVLGMTVLGLTHLLGLVGLFDTWYDFRIRFRRLALLRQVAFRRENHDN